MILDFGLSDAFKGYMKEYTDLMVKFLRSLDNKSMTEKEMLLILDIADNVGQVDNDWTHKMNDALGFCSLLFVRKNASTAKGHRAELNSHTYLAVDMYSFFAFFTILRKQQHKGFYFIDFMPLRIDPYGRGEYKYKSAHEIGINHGILDQVDNIETAFVNHSHGQTQLL